MASQPIELLTGGAGAYSAPPRSSVAPTSANALVGGGGIAPHYGPVVLVGLAVLILFVLDRAGFRFAVTAGRR